MSPAASLARISAEFAPHRLSGVLDGLAQELERLQQKVLRLQEVCNGPDPDPAMVLELQVLDLMTQKLSALSQFVRDLIEVLPEDPMLDLSGLLRAVPLQDLADRLSARAAGTPTPAVEDRETGDFDLF